MIHFLWRINMNSSTPEKSPGTKSPYKTISPRFISTRLVSIFFFRSASSVQLILVIFSMSVVNFHEIFAWNRVSCFGVRKIKYTPSWHMHTILNRFRITMTVYFLHKSLKGVYLFQVSRLKVTKRAERVDILDFTRVLLHQDHKEKMKNRQKLWSSRNCHVARRHEPRWNTIYVSKKLEL